jgi:urease accessory protein
MPARATAWVRAAEVKGAPFASIVLDAGQRRVRRKLLPLPGGEGVLVDFDVPVTLGDGDCLALGDGRLVRIVAAREDLTEVRGEDSPHLLRLVWHIGNRHLDAQIEASRILIRRDPVIARMLGHLGARLKDVRETFAPEHGAYLPHAHSGGHDPGRGHGAYPDEP